jgi:hypothetical protein
MTFFEPVYLWLDDERPAPSGWRWAKNFGNAKQLVHLSCQIPGRQFELRRLSFDHDLGGQVVEVMRQDGRLVRKEPSPLNGYHLAKDILEFVNLGMLPPFAWRVHSQNPVGVQNIKFVMAQVEVLWAQQEWPDWPDVV